MSGYQGLIQPIVVRRSGSHEQMVVAAARASVAAWLAAPDLPVWEEWLSGPFAKTVRRARPVEVDKVRPYALASAAVGDREAYAEAFALAPYDKTDLPREVAKLQVSGLDAERAGWDTVPTAPEGAPRLLVNTDAGMTTGKTCAQAAHALFGWALRQTAADLAVWQAEGLRFAVTEVPYDVFAKMRTDAVVVIADAGHTEVERGTETVLTLP